MVFLRVLDFVQFVGRRFAGAQHGSRVSQMALNVHCERVRAAEDASRDPFRVLERRHGLAEILERGGGVIAERYSVNLPRPERGVITISENASRNGNRSAQQRLGFFEAP